MLYPIYLICLTVASLVVSIIAIVVAVRAHLKNQALQHLLRIYGQIIRRLPGADKAIEEGLAESQAIVEIIKQAQVRLKEAFLEHFPFRL